MTSTKLETRIEGKALRLSGSVLLSNQGNEMAQQVFPTLRLGKWGWSGEVRKLEPGAQSEWALQADIPLSDFACDEVSPCAQGEAAPKGLFPLLVRSHYSDLNGYKFTAPDVISLTAGDLSPHDIALVHEPELQTKLTITGSGESFRGNLKILNNAGSARKLIASVHTSQELTASPIQEIVTLDPQREAEWQFSVKNYSATIGSSYPVYVFVSWQDDGLRNLKLTSGIIKIERQGRMQPILLAGAAILAILLLLRLRRRAV